MNLHRHWVREAVGCCAQPMQARDAAKKNFALYKCFSRVKGKAAKGRLSLIACPFHTAEPTDYCLGLPGQLNPFSGSAVRTCSCIHTQSVCCWIPQIDLWGSCWPKAFFSVLLNPCHWKHSIAVQSLHVTNQQRGCHMKEYLMHITRNRRGGCSLHKCRQHVIRPDCSKSLATLTE